MLFSTSFLRPRVSGLCQGSGKTSRSVPDKVTRQGSRHTALAWINLDATRYGRPACSRQSVRACSLQQRLGCRLTPWGPVHSGLLETRGQSDSPMRQIALPTVAELHRRRFTRWNARGSAVSKSSTSGELVFAESNLLDALHLRKRIADGFREILRFGLEARLHRSGAHVTRTERPACLAQDTDNIVLE